MRPASPTSRARRSRRIAGAAATPQAASGASAADGDLAALRNLGPYSATLLAAGGIHTVAELRALGAVAAFHRVRFARGGDASLLLLYALEGALTGQRWDQLDGSTRERLRRAAEAPDARHAPGAAESA